MQPWEADATAYERAINIDDRSIVGAVWISQGNAPSWLIVELIQSIERLYKAQSGLELRVEKLSVVNGEPTEFSYILHGEPNAIAKLVASIKDIIRRVG